MVSRAKERADAEGRTVQPDFLQQLWNGYNAYRTPEQVKAAEKKRKEDEEAKAKKKKEKKDKKAEARIRALDKDDHLRDAQVARDKPIAYYSQGVDYRWLALLFLLAWAVAWLILLLIDLLPGSSGSLYLYKIIDTSNNSTNSAYLEFGPLSYKLRAMQNGTEQSSYGASYSLTVAQLTFLQYCPEALYIITNTPKALPGFITTSLILAFIAWVLLLSIFIGMCCFIPRGRLRNARINWPAKLWKPWLYVAFLALILLTITNYYYAFALYETLQTLNLAFVKAGQPYRAVAGPDHALLIAALIIEFLVVFFSLLPTKSRPGVGMLPYKKSDASAAAAGGDKGKDKNDGKDEKSDKKTDDKQVVGGAAGFGGGGAGGGGQFINFEPKIENINNCYGHTKESGGKVVDAQGGGHAAAPAVAGPAPAPAVVAATDNHHPHDPVVPVPVPAPAGSSATGTFHTAHSQHPHQSASHRDPSERLVSEADQRRPGGVPFSGQGSRRSSRQSEHLVESRDGNRGRRGVPEEARALTEQNLADHNNATSSDDMDPRNELLDQAINQRGDAHIPGVPMSAFNQSEAGDDNQDASAAQLVDRRRRRGAGHSSRSGSNAAMSANDDPASRARGLNESGRGPRGLGFDSEDEVARNNTGDDAARSRDSVLMDREINGRGRNSRGLGYDNDQDRINRDNRDDSSAASGPDEHGQGSARSERGAPAESAILVNRELNVRGQNSRGLGFDDDQRSSIGDNRGGHAAMTGPNDRGHGRAQNQRDDSPDSPSLVDRQRRGNGGIAWDMNQDSPSDISVGDRATDNNRGAQDQDRVGRGSGNMFDTPILVNRETDRQRQGPSGVGQEPDYNGGPIAGEELGAAANYYRPAAGSPILGSPGPGEGSDDDFRHSGPHSRGATDSPSLDLNSNQHRDDTSHQLVDPETRTRNKGTSIPDTMRDQNAIGGPVFGVNTERDNDATRHRGVRFADLISSDSSRSQTPELIDESNTNTTAGRGARSGAGFPYSPDLPSPLRNAREQSDTPILIVPDRFDTRRHGVGDDASGNASTSRQTDVTMDQETSGQPQLVDPRPPFVRRSGLRASDTGVYGSYDSQEADSNDDTSQDADSLVDPRQRSVPRGLSDQREAIRRESVSSEGRSGSSAQFSISNNGDRWDADSRGHTPILGRSPTTSDRSDGAGSADVLVFSPAQGHTMPRMYLSADTSDQDFSQSDSTLMGGRRMEAGPSESRGHRSNSTAQDTTLPPALWNTSSATQNIDWTSDNPYGASSDSRAGNHSENSSIDHEMNAKLQFPSITQFEEIHFPESAILAPPIALPRDITTTQPQDGSDLSRSTRDVRMYPIESRREPVEINTPYVTAPSSQNVSRASSQSSQSEAAIGHVEVRTRIFPPGADVPSVVKQESFPLSDKICQKPNCKCACHTPTKVCKDSGCNCRCHKQSEQYRKPDDDFEGPGTGGAAGGNRQGTANKGANNTSGHGRSLGASGGSSAEGQSGGSGGGQSHGYKMNIAAAAVNDAQAQLDLARSRLKQKMAKTESVSATEHDAEEESRQKRSLSFASKVEALSVPRTSSAGIEKSMRGEISTSKKSMNEHNLPSKLNSKSSDADALDRRRVKKSKLLSKAESELLSPSKQTTAVIKPKSSMMLDSALDLLTEPGVTKDIVAKSWSDSRRTDADLGHSTLTSGLASSKSKGSTLSSSAIGHTSLLGGSALTSSTLAGSSLSTSSLGGSGLGGSGLSRSVLGTSLSSTGLMSSRLATSGLSSSSLVKSSLGSSNLGKSVLGSSSLASTSLKPSTLGSTRLAGSSLASMDTESMAAYLAASLPTEDKASPKKSSRLAASVLDRDDSLRLPATPETTRGSRSRLRSSLSNEDLRNSTPISEPKSRRTRFADDNYASTPMAPPISNRFAKRQEVSRPVSTSALGYGDRYAYSEPSSPVFTKPATFVTTPSSPISPTRKTLLLPTYKSSIVPSTVGVPTKTTRSVLAAPSSVGGKSVGAPPAYSTISIARPRPQAKSTVGSSSSVVSEALPAYTPGSLPAYSAGPSAPASKVGPKFSLVVVDPPALSSKSSKAGMSQSMPSSPVSAKVPVLSSDSKKSALKSGEMLRFNLEKPKPVVSSSPSAPRDLEKRRQFFANTTTSAYADINLIR